MMKITDTTTGRTGRLVESPGYVVGGTYINPSWRIAWDDIEPEEEEDDES